MRFLLACALFFWCSAAFSQTKEEAAKFILDNSAINFLSCDQVIMTKKRNPADGSDYWYGYKFNPTEVRVMYSLDGEVVVKCNSGRCIERTDRDCTDDRDFDQCYNRIKRKLSSGKDIEYDSETYIVETPIVSGKRFVKAWDYFIANCGGIKKPVF